MGIFYYDTNAAAGADTGLSKADAFKTIVSALAGTTKGDYIYTSHLSNDTDNFITVNIDSRIFISVDFAGSTPPVPADWIRGAIWNGFGISSSDVIVQSTSGGYVYGFVLTATDNIQFTFGNQVMHNCEYSTSGFNDLLDLRGNAIHLDCDITLGSVSWINVASGSHNIIIGGSLSGTTDPVIKMTGGVLTLKNVDISSWAGLLVSFNNSTTPQRVILEGCILNAGVTLSNAITDIGPSLDLYGSSATNQPYIILEDSFYGTMQSETTVIKTGGSSDGVTPISLKFVSNANPIVGYNGINNVMPILFWADTIGNNTFEVDVLTDGLTLTEEDAFIEVCHPQAGVQRALASSVDHAGANLAASAATWVTTGIGAPSKQKISITVNVGQKGWIEARLYFTRPSAVMYADVKVLDGDHQYLAGSGAYINDPAVTPDDYPVEGDVRLGIDYDNAALTGTLAVPAVGDVRDGIAIDDTIGTYEPAAEADVLAGEQYGAGGVEFTGTLSPFTATYELPQELVYEDEEIILLEDCEP